MRKDAAVRGVSQDATILSLEFPVFFPDTREQRTGEWFAGDCILRPTSTLKMSAGKSFRSYVSAVPLVVEHLFP